MSEKAKLALYWAASCGGCEIAVLAINEKILDVANAFDIVMWPVAVDGKVHHIEAMDDKSIDLCLFNGAIRTSEQEYMAQLLRRKSKVLVAFGSCAHEGGIPGLANATTKDAIFDTVYQNCPSVDNPNNIVPQTETEVDEGTLHLPLYYKEVRGLGQTVDVDYYLPGCPPEPESIWDAIVAILENKLPPAGSVIGAHTTVCDTCDRVKTEKKIKAFKRTWEVIPNETDCLLEQGIVCCGPATRAGCGALCPSVGSPCIGCYGPNEGVEDFGARLMSALASVIDSDDPDEIDRIIKEGIPDPIGTFYRFSLPDSLLHGIAAHGSNGHHAEDEA
ncbi:MAG: F420-nonreducing hydrogenase [Anaerolineales bacterium]|jgi:F420-non-reducing hydrogenase small subunit